MHKLINYLDPLIAITRAMLGIIYHSTYIAQNIKNVMTMMVDNATSNDMQNPYI